MRAIKHPSSAALMKGIKDMYKRSPEREWREHVAAVVKQIRP
jgi:hypothetical protein